MKYVKRYFYVVWGSFFDSGSLDGTLKVFLLEVLIDSDSQKKEGPLNYVSVALVLYTFVPLEQ